MIIHSIDKAVWKIYGIWALWVGIAFFSIYPTCNWITAQRPRQLALYIEPELSIPFVPEFVWIYFSMYILFIVPPFLLDVARVTSLGKQLLFGTIASGIIFLICPSKLGFERAIPGISFYGSLFSNLFTVDLPHNMAPSLHVVFSTLILFMLAKSAHKVMVKFFLWTWLVLICVSTLLVHQHHLIDIFTALALAFCCSYYVQKGELHA